MKLFITGERQVGKSTLLKKILKKINCDYSGLESFVSVNGEQRTVFIADIKNRNNCRKAGVRLYHKNIEVSCDVFNSFGVELLSGSTPLVVIDEIGQLEESSELYKEKIISLLENPNVNLLGIIRKDACEQLRLAVYKYAEVIELTEENRSLYERIEIPSIIDKNRKTN